MMVKLTFNKFERVAGLFVLSALIGSVVLGVGVAVKRGWFEPKIKYQVEFQNAEGIHAGTLVQITGLKAGAVESVELQSDNRVVVKFHVFGKYQRLIRQDSAVYIARTFIIGEKILDITVGSETAKVLEAGASLQAKSSSDLMDMFSGRRMSESLHSLSSLFSNVGKIAEAFSDPKRTEAFISTFDTIAPLTKNLNDMSLEVIDLSRQLTHDQNIGVLVKNLASTTTELNHMLPVLQKHAPAMAEDVRALLGNMNILTKEIVKLAPVLDQVAGDLPQAGQRAIEAVDEATVVLKALQKTFILRSASREVREEEEVLRAAQRKKKQQELLESQQRLPASE